jgi:aldehyde dehydrogenase (NAD(P)+)
MSASLVMSATAQSASSTDELQLDRAIAVLIENAQRFARMSPADKATLLRKCIPRIADTAHAWVDAGTAAKGLPPDHIGEEYLAGPIPTVRAARLLAESLDDIASKGRPPLGRRSRFRDDGRLVVDVFPNSPLDRVMFGGFSGYVLMEEGVDRTAARAKQATFFQQRNPTGGVSLVLGAGNVSSIPPMDVFTKMFEEGYVCLLKMNPVNEWSGPFLERALAPLVSAGFLRIVYGGADVGKYLVEHEAIADIHITGSDRTHDLIVWGPPGPDRDRRIAANEPLLTKPISSELGNVSPVAVVPYTYTDDELWFQARNVVSMVANNGSFNCNAAKLLITSKRWAQREQFLDMVARGLSQVPTRKAYYPGAFDRYDRLTGGRDGVSKFGTAGDDVLPWAFIRGVDSSNPDEDLFRVEPFCGILSETNVGSADPVEFLDTVTAFMNDRVWGTLNACIIIHPKLSNDVTIGRVLDRSITELRYGTVAINHWPALGYAFGTPPWGGHQSVTLDDIQSGLGWVHNSYMLGGIDKSVIRGDLRVRPHPLWFYDNPRAHKAAPNLLKMESAPTWGKLPGLLWRVLT